MAGSSAGISEQELGSAPVDVASRLSLHPEFHVNRIAKASRPPKAASATSASSEASSRSKNSSMINCGSGGAGGGTCIEGAGNTACADAGAGGSGGGGESVVRSESSSTPGR